MEPRCCSKEAWGFQEPLTKVSEKLKSQTQGHEHDTKMSICRISSLPNSTPWLEGLGWRGCAPELRPFWKKPSGNFPGERDPQRSLLYCLRCLLKREALLRASSSPIPSPGLLLAPWRGQTVGRAAWEMWSQGKGEGGRGSHYWCPRPGTEVSPPKSLYWSPNTNVTESGSN